jgi:hypothetical protein
MKNPDYSPDTAHLPSARDRELWRLGGQEKERSAREKLARIRAKSDEVERRKAELFDSLRKAGNAL